jgi:hypothetical protein
MELGSAALPVLVEITVVVQVGERGRIGHPFVEFADLLAAVHVGPPNQTPYAGCSAQSQLAHVTASVPAARSSTWARLLARVLSLTDRLQRQSVTASASQSLTRRFCCRARAPPSTSSTPGECAGRRLRLFSRRPPDQAFAPWVDAIANTASRLNDAGFWRGGNLMKFSICAATTACMRYICGM